ncbi:hypothetical protein B0H14DRAFT_3883819 [Mycena olivaceomarginata]|nr:hypothetical protein B0H14DRAFT_3883819 [Mycena olivaceomarginata]
MHPGAVGAAPDSSAATPPHLGHSYAPRPIPAAHPSYSPVALPFPSIADGGLQVRVMPPSQHSRVAPHLPPSAGAGFHTHPVAPHFPRAPQAVVTASLYATPYTSPSSRRAAGMQGGVGAVISALAALAPHLPALSQRHSTPADVNREISRSPALLAAPIQRRRIRQCFGVTLVHGTLDGALAAA